MQLPKKSVHDDDEGSRQKGQGSPNGGNRLQVSDFFFYLSIKWQEEINYKCQIFFLLYTKLKGGFS